MFRFELSRREDSRGVIVGVYPVLTLFAHHWRDWVPPGRKALAFCVKLQIGRGAGYIRGRTAFLSWRAKGGAQTSRRLRAGFTQNANVIPYGFRAGG